MNYSDEELEKMDRDELLQIAKRLSKWSRECYEYFIRKERSFGSPVRSSETGQMMSFSDFVEKCDLGKYIQNYISEAITEKINRHT